MFCYTFSKCSKSFIYFVNKHSLSQFPIKQTHNVRAAFVEMAWSERDAAFLREQNAQTQMHTMRDKLKQIEKESRKTETGSRDE